MKNIYSILSLCFVMMSVSLFGQVKIYAPSLTAPTDMAVGQMPNATLDWNAVTGDSLVIIYELEVANNADFTNSELFPKTDLTALTMTDLLFGQTYYWRVKAYDGGYESDWSEVWSFTVAWNVEMKNPSDGDKVFTNPEITWNELTGLVGYQLQIDTVYDWKKDESGVTTDIYDSYIVTNDDIWAVGNDGLVLHNDGTGWMVKDIGVSVNLKAVSFIDANMGYVVGDEGTVVSYDGTDWTVVDIGTTEDLTGVSFADADNGVVVGLGGTVVVYNTGSWEVVTTGDNNDLYDVSMLGASNIWACGKGKIVVNYNGTEWAANQVGSKDNYAITMVDENNGCVVGKSGEVFHWNGMIWYEEETGTSKNLNGVSFDGATGYAVGASGTVLMFNGKWNQITSGVGEDLQSVSVANGSGIITGVDGVIISKNGSGFNSPFLKTYELAGDTTSWQFNDLLFGQTFYYRLRGYHSIDTSMWSGVKSFTTQASPVLVAPDDGVTTDLEMEFEWEEYEGITNYIIEVDWSASFNDPSSFTTEVDTIVLVTSSFGVQYFWRVATQHAMDISDWSEVWTFTTVNTVALESPANNAKEVALCPLYSWGEIIGASYEIWIDIDESFSNPVMHTSDDPQHQCQSSLEKGVIYYWKVRGVSGVNHSEWSETWSFETEGAIGIDEQFNADAVNIYPNPGNGEFNVYLNSLESKDYQLQVVDIAGKLIHDQTINCQIGSNNIPVNINSIESGTYNLIISDNDNTISKRLLIK